MICNDRRFGTFLESYTGSTWEQRLCLHTFHHVVCHLACYFNPNKDTWNSFVEQIPVFIHWFRQKEINSSWQCFFFLLPCILRLFLCDGQGNSFSSETSDTFLLFPAQPLTSFTTWSTLSLHLFLLCLVSKVLQCFGADEYCFRVSLRHYTGVRTLSDSGSKCTAIDLSCSRV